MLHGPFAKINRGLQAISGLELTDWDSSHLRWLLSLFALLPGLSWGALFPLGFGVLFWWVIPSLMVPIGNRLVRSDELERRRLERELGLPESEPQIEAELSEQD